MNTYNLLSSVCLVIFAGLAGCGPEPSVNAPGGGGGEGGSGGTGGHVGGHAECLFKSECTWEDGPVANKVVCDDDFPKTLDRCIPVPRCGGVCAHVGAQCDFLDPADVQQMICDDDNPCTADACGEQNACVNQAAVDGAPCRDGVCQGGVCVD